MKSYRRIMLGRKSTDAQEFFAGVHIAHRVGDVCSMR